MNHHVFQKDMLSRLPYKPDHYPTLPMPGRITGMPLHSGDNGVFSPASGSGSPRSPAAINTPSTITAW